MNAIAPVESIPLEPALSPSLPTLLDFLARMVRDPSVDVGKLEALIRIQREIIADEARLAFNEAMNAAQAEMMPVIRDANNDQTSSKYARLETIDAAIRPIYTRHGLHLSFNSEPIDGPNDRIVLEVTRGRHTKRFQLEAAPDTMGPQGRPNKTPLHGLASTVSYLRRYLTCMAFNIVLRGDDNDGNRQPPITHDGRISQGQAAELQTMMQRGRLREQTVLEKMAPGLRSIEQLASRDFARVKNALLSRISVLDQRTQEAARAEQRIAASNAAAARRPQNGDSR